MKKGLLLFWVAGLVFSPLALKAEEAPIKSKIESVALFKNGLAVVRHVVFIEQNGDYVLEDLANEPVHGTFWIESDATVKARATMKDVETPSLNLNQLNLQQGFAGQNVEVYFKEPGQAPLKGVIEQVEQSHNWDQNYNPRASHDYFNAHFGYRQNIPFLGLNLAVRTEEGLNFIDPSSIAYLKVVQAKTAVKIRKPVIILNVEKISKPPSPIVISYLTKGLSWAPSYRIELLDDARLSLQQTGVIKNEFADIEGAELSLITGFPQIKFAHVTSPLSLKTSLSQFFFQLNNTPRAMTGLATNAMAQQALSVHDLAPVSGLDLNLTPKGEGVDLYFQSIGKNTLKEGDSLFVTLALAQAPYKRIVEWIVPDTRNPDGRQIQEYERQQNPDKYQDAAWDAVSFKNPFDFPMTTGAVSIYSQGKFNGQSQSDWVSAGEVNVVYITKALSLRTLSVEQEDPGERVSVKLGGNQFQKVTIKGELSVQSHRVQDIVIQVRRQFSGELMSASDNPETVLREEGVYSVNKRNELKWFFTLKAGEEKKLTYRYSVLTPY